MRILEDIIKKADDTFDEIWYYTEKAHTLKHEYRSLADTYIKIAEMHVTIYNMLHEQMVMLIETEKKKNIEVPKGMQDVWNYEHSRLIKEFNEVKFLIEEYKKMN